MAYHDFLAQASNLQIDKCTRPVTPRSTPRGKYRDGYRVVHVPGGGTGRVQVVARYLLQGRGMAVRVSLAGPG